jgi:CubicO group peptidase (beta-lactamase class C family)
MRFAVPFALLATTLLLGDEQYPPPRFMDPQRTAKLESAMPDLDRIFNRFAVTEKIPGMVWGVVIDGRLAHVSSAGVRNLPSHSGIDASTVFRIASMTKSFTALAILKLRDEGKLSLEDPVAKWIPEFTRMPLPTRDTAPPRIRQLMSHSAGFPEDNPWGDRQLATSDTELTKWLKAGIPFSTPPDTRYEYSNYAFGLLGRIVTRVSGVPYEKYVQREILAKLGMTESTLEFSTVPADKRATGYRLEPDGTYLEEPPLPHGAFGSMGGMLTDAEDLGKYVAFHLSAWPPRDDEDTGPVRRSSIREMNHLWRPANLTASTANGILQVSASGYGYGLRVTSDCRFELMVGHGGGLPGFGSYMLWLPDYGVGLFAMANLTYAGPAAPINAALDLLLKTGGLQKRELPASPVLTRSRESLWNLWNHWDDAEVRKIASMNLLLDEPPAQRKEDIRKLKEEVGACASAGPVLAENWLRGQFNLRCEKGTVGVFFTMSPTQPPAVQHLRFRKLENESLRMGAPTGAPAGIACRQ